MIQQVFRPLNSQCFTEDPNPNPAAVLASFLASFTEFDPPVDVGLDD